MNMFERLLEWQPVAESVQTSLPPEAVLVYLDRLGLADHVHRECNLVTIEDRLMEVIQRNRLGAFDGNELGIGHAMLSMYGPDAERLFAGVEQTLRDYPLCQGARVIIRRGGPGAEQREIRL
jgi:hypothetical protein